MVGSLLILSLLAPQQRDSAALVRALVNAINTKDVARRQSLQHPGDRVCAIPQYVEGVIKRQTRFVVPSNYQWEITPLKEPPFPGMMNYAVKPTHALRITYKTGEFSSVAINSSLARDASGWREVHGCPTPKFAEALQQTRPGAATRKTNIAERVGNMPRGVRDSLLALDLNGQITGWKYYLSVAPTDTTTAMLVVDSIVKRHRLTFRQIDPQNRDRPTEDRFITIDTIDGQFRGRQYRNGVWVNVPLRGLTWHGDTLLIGPRRYFRTD